MATRYLNDLKIEEGDLQLEVGSNAAPQSYDKIHIGGAGLDSSDAAIYIGNRGDGSGYGYRMYYYGAGSGNNNKLIFKSENLGNTVDMLSFTADGNCTFSGTISTASHGSSTNWKQAYDNHITGIAVTGTSTKTITLTQRDGGTITTTFTDLEGSGGGIDMTNGFNNRVVTAVDSDSINAEAGLLFNGSYLEITPGNIATPLHIKRTGASTRQVNLLLSAYDGSTTSEGFLGVDSSADLRYGASSNTSANSLVLTEDNLILTEGDGIKITGTIPTPTISVNYDTGDSDNLILAASTVTSINGASSSYGAYMLVAESNPGLAQGPVNKIRVSDIHLDDFGAAEGTINLGSNRIINLASPQTANDAVNKTYADTKVSKAGDTMTGDLSFTSSGITGLGKIHYGVNGTMGQTTQWNPNSNNPGLWIEAEGGESGGVFMNGNTFALWSPGDDDIFKVYDEDNLPSGSPKFRITSGALAVGYSGFSSDANAKTYTWRALDNTSNSSNQYYRIARISGNQSSRFIIELAGRSTSYSDNRLPAFGKIVGQLNNDNNYDIVYYNASATDEVVDEVGQVDISTTQTDIYVRVGQFSELVATGSISDGGITPYGGDNGSTSAPSNYVQATEYKLWNQGNDGANSGLDADLLDGQQGSYYANTSTAQTINGNKTFGGSTQFNGTVEFGDPVTFDSDVTLDGISSMTETTALVMNGGNEVGFRTLGSNAFNSTSFLTSESDTLATVTGRGASTTTSCTFNTITMNTPVVGSSNKIKFANNDYIRFDDANGVGRFHFDCDGSTNNASVQAATFVGALSGNASTASSAAKWTTARTITLAGDLSGSVSIDGSANVTLTASVNDDSHDLTWANIDGETSNSVNGWGGLRHQTNDGYIDFGPANSSWAHIYTDRPNFYFNKELYVNNQRVFHQGYHPNADTLTTARTIAGSSFNGSANIDISYNNLTNKPTIPSGASLVKVYNNQNYVASSSSTSNRGNFGQGLTVYEGYSSGTNRPFTYDTTLQIMSTTSQGFEISADWVSNSSTPLKVRSLRDCCQGWNPWTTIWTEHNFTSTNVSNWNTAYGWGNHASAGYLTGSPTSITIGGILLEDSSDRSGLLEINQKGSSGWSGIQIVDGSNRWSFMGNNSNVGIYDDLNGEWVLLYDVNGATELYYNGSMKVWTKSTGIGITGGITSTGSWSYTNGSYGTQTIGYYYGAAYWYNSSLTYYVGSVTGTSSSVNKLAVKGSIGVGGASASNTWGKIDASNDIVAYSSDKRLKENILPINSALDKISKLSGFTYNWNQKAKEEAAFNTEERLVGVFAQDVQEVLPEAVKIAPFDNDGNDVSKSGEDYLTVQYEKIVPLLIEGIKEQQAQIEELTTKLEKVTKQLNNGNNI